MSSIVAFSEKATPKHTRRASNKYKVQIQYVEAIVTYEVRACSKKAAQMATDCWAATCSGIEDGRVRPGDKIGREGRFIAYDRGPSLADPIVDRI